MNWLPPGQIETRRFPVVGERAPSSDLASNPGNWALEIEGAVANPMTCDLRGFLDLATRDLVFDIHCVTSWTRFDSRFTGIPLREILSPSGVESAANFVSFQAYSDRGHHTSLPLDLALEHSWAVHAFDGEPLDIEHGGPVRVVTPGRYFYKSIKWLRKIVVLEEDRPGWWEVNSSYHPNADPTSGTERFTSGSIRPDQVNRFLTADSYDKYRGRVLLGLDLRQWAPKSKDLRRIYLKNCDLRGVDLTNADLRESNLSLSDLTGAQLSGADLSGSDLEGARFGAANLSGADLSSTALSATRFVSESGHALVTGLKVHGAWGLLESEEANLLGQGVDISETAR
ncbi:MAG TPA: molybdopterin-dependent oxidoreductase [Acidimicrobiia bacterium]